MRRGRHLQNQEESHAVPLRDVLTASLSKMPEAIEMYRSVLRPIGPSKRLPPGAAS